MLAGLRTSRGVSLHQLLELLPPPPTTTTAPSDPADSGGGDDAAAAVDDATPASFSSPLPDLWAYLQQLQVCLQRANGDIDIIMIYYDIL
eukprot:COSAG01_NODE_34277_length_550_cov_1.086475_1_plen_90_part_00